MYAIVNDFAGATSDTHIRRLRDDAIIPADPLNADWRAYQAWLAAGNTPAPAPPAEAKPKGDAPTG